MGVLDYDSIYVTWNTSQHFCESHDGGIEYWNIITSFFICFVGILIFIRVHKSPLIMMAGLTFFCNGLASILFHSSGYFSYGLIDKTTLTWTFFFVMIHHFDTTWLSKSRSWVKLILYAPFLIIFLAAMPYMAFVGVFDKFPAYDMLPLLLFCFTACASGGTYLWKTKCPYLPHFFRTTAVAGTMIVTNYIYENYGCSSLTSHIPIHSLFHLVASHCVYNFIIVSYCVEHGVALNFESKFNKLFPVPNSRQEEELELIISAEYSPTTKVDSRLMMNDIRQNFSESCTTLD